MRYKDDNSWIFGFACLLLMVVLIPVEMVSAFPDLDDPRWDPGLPLIRTAGFGSELSLSSEADGVRMAIDWAYADDKRFAFVYHISGIPYDPQLSNLNGNFSISDHAGNNVRFFGEGFCEWEDKDKGVIRGSWSGAFLEEMTGPVQFPLNLAIILNSDSPGIGAAGTPFIGMFRVFETIPKDQPPTARPVLGPFQFTLDIKREPLQRLELNQVVTAAGIGLELRRLEFTPSVMEVTLCLADEAQGPLNPTGDYMEEMPMLEIAGQQALLKGVHGGFSAVQQFSSFPIEPGPDQNCQKLQFLLGKTEDGQEMKLTVPNLQKPNEPGRFADALGMMNLNPETPQFNETGIQFEYVVKVVPDSTEIRFDILDKPQGMSEAEAYRQIYLRTGFMVEGPWVFELDLR